MISNEKLAQITKLQKVLKIKFKKGKIKDYIYGKETLIAFFFSGT